jgi:hypothetical protein
VGLAPAGGWAKGDDSVRHLLRFQAEMHELAKTAAPYAESARDELLAHQLLGMARCDAAIALIDSAHTARWSLDAERITCPVRIVWGTADKLLPWPSAAARFRNEWLPHADWVELEGIGHCPQLDIPRDRAAHPRIHGVMSIWPRSVRVEGERPAARRRPIPQEAQLMTQYLLAMYQPTGGSLPPEKLEPIMRDLDAINQALRAENAWVFAGGLHEPDASTVVRANGSDVLMTDGPFAEGKEHLGGFTVIDVPDLDAALGWAGKIAKASTLPIEVRPFRHSRD